MYKLLINEDLKKVNTMYKDDRNPIFWLIFVDLLINTMLRWITVILCRSVFRPKSTSPSFFLTEKSTAVSVTGIGNLISSEFRIALGKGSDFRYTN